MLIALDEDYYKSRYRQAFDEKICNTLPEHSYYDCEIDFKPNAKFNAKPVTVPPLSSEEDDALRKHLNDYLRKGFIRYSKSPIHNTVKFRTDKNGELKVYVDFDKYKNDMIKFKYPIPKIPNIYEDVKGSTVFSRINIKSAFNAIRMYSGDEPKTAIKTKYGVFEYLIMPQGLPDGSCRFQSFMEHVLREGLNQYIKVYVDDILIYSKDTEQHHEHIQNVLRMLIEHHLVVNQEKSEFLKSEILYLGHVLCKDGVKIDPAKIKKIREWTVPDSVSEIRSFIGTCNFLRQYVPNMSSILRPLNLLTRNGVQRVWDIGCYNALSILNELLRTAPTLAYPDHNKPFIVHIDSDDDTISASVSQISGCENKIIYYSSKALSNSELNYNKTQKDLLALKLAFGEWRHLLLNATYQIQVHTFNVNLYRALMNDSTLREYMEDFNYCILGPNGLDDGGVSKRSFTSIYKPEDYDSDDIYDSEDDYEDFSLKDIRQLYKYDDYAQEILDDLKYDTNFSGYVYNWMKSGGLLVRKYNTSQKYISPELQRSVLRSTYKKYRMDGLSFNKLYKLITEDYWWPGVKQDIKDYFRERREFQKRRVQKNKNKPWKVVHINFMNNIRVNSTKRATIMICRDHKTKMAHFIGFNHNPDGRQTAQAFYDNVVKLHGSPTVVVFPSEIRTEEWKHLLRFCNASYYIADNSIENKDKQFVKGFLRDLVRSYNSENWKVFLSIAEACYNNFVHPTIRQSPLNALLQYQGKGFSGRSVLNDFLHLSKRSHNWRDFKRMLIFNRERIFGY